MPAPAPSSPACQNRQLLIAANARSAADEAAVRIRDDVQLGLRQFTDSFLDALGGDFLAESDERRLRDQYRHQPTALAAKLAQNRRTLSAQRALHCLYGKLVCGAALSGEEQALAEHARDLCDHYTQAETDERCRAAGL